jgi:hypothetical protein
MQDKNNTKMLRAGILLSDSVHTNTTTEYTVIVNKHDDVINQVDPLLWVFECKVRSSSDMAPVISTLRLPRNVIKVFAYVTMPLDCLCCLVVTVLGYRSEGPGSIPGTTKKKRSGSGTGSTQPREYN